MPAIGTVLGGGVTLYKSAKESGPKAEFVLFKVQIEHNEIFNGVDKTAAK